MFVAEADVYGFSDTFALLAAHEGRVRNWHNIVTFPVTPVKVKPKYQYLGEVTTHEAHNPQYPILKRYERHGRR